MFGRKKQMAELRAQADRLVADAERLVRMQEESSKRLAELERQLDQAACNGLIQRAEIEELKRTF